MVRLFGRLSVSNNVFMLSAGWLWVVTSACPCSYYFGASFYKNNFVLKLAVVGGKFRILCR